MAEFEITTEDPMTGVNQTDHSADTMLDALRQAIDAGDLDADLDGRDEGEVTIRIRAV